MRGAGPRPVEVLRDEGGGCQGNALPASAYFSSARALGSIQHHREFPDQTHPLDTRPPPPTSHPFVHPTLSSSVSPFSLLSPLCLHPSSFSLFLQLLSSIIPLDSSSLSLALPLVFFLSVSPSPLSSSLPFLSSFTERTRLSPFGVVTLFLRLSRPSRPSLSSRPVSVRRGLPVQRSQKLSRRFRWVILENNRRLACTATAVN